MAQEQKMQMPGVFGGLMRYDSEYKSKFTFSPSAIVAYLVSIIAFVLILKIFFPIAG
jgi:preprotein translocase subunit Sec61beta